MLDRLLHSKRKANEFGSAGKAAVCCGGDIELFLSSWANVWISGALPPQRQFDILEFLKQKRSPPPPPGARSLTPVSDHYRVAVIKTD